MTQTPLAYHAGQFKSLESVTISLADAGFVYGATATDQCRTYRQVPFRLEEHLQRFRRSCEMCRISQPVRDEKLRDVTLELLETNRDRSRAEVEWTVVFLATPGEIGSFLGQAAAAEADPQLFVYCYPLPFSRFRQYYINGADLRVPRRMRHLPSNIISPQAKQRSRLFWWLAEREVRDEHPDAQALLLSPDGFVTETSSANFLLVRREVLHSPRSVHILPGISLQATREIAREAGIPFVECDLTEHDLSQCDEAFLTSTPFGIAPVGSMAGRRLPVNGPVFERLLHGWNDLAGLDIREQFLGSTS
jgi:branched-chain amino acid aminotransferase